MATVAAHTSQASHNQAFLDTIDRNLFPDWVITAAFYKAVHIVEALLVRKGTPSGNHTNRNAILKRQFTTVWHDYHPLYNQSRVVRYLCVSVTASDVTQALTRLAAVEAAAAAIP
jgi:hypothetical protein